MRPQCKVPLKGSIRVEALYRNLILATIKRVKW